MVIHIETTFSFQTVSISTNVLENSEYDSHGLPKNMRIILSICLYLYFYIDIISIRVCDALDTNVGRKSKDYSVKSVGFCSK